MLFLLKHRVWIAKFNDTTISVMLSKEKTYSEQQPRCCYQCEGDRRFDRWSGPTKYNWYLFSASSKAHNITE